MDNADHACGEHTRVLVSNIAKGHASELSMKVGTPYGPGKVAVLTPFQLFGYIQGITEIQ
jgi:hypothetical protein